MDNLYSGGKSFMKKDNLIAEKTKAFAIQIIHLYL